MRRTVSAITVIAVGVATGWFALGSVSVSESQAEEDTVTPIALTTVEIVRQDVINSEEVDGVLGYGSPLLLPGGAVGTVTWLPDEGSIIEFGDKLYEIDEQPVILLQGSTPAYRTLERGITDGRDIQQLEEALVALGFAEEAAMSANGEFSSATRSAVKRWQEALGIRETGRIEFGWIVFAPKPIRVARQVVSLGARTSGAVIEVTRAERRVTVELAADRRDLLNEGLSVEVELPDGRVVAGQVDSVSSVAKRSTDGNGPATFETVISLGSDADGGFDEAPVDVRVTEVEARAVLTVPISALLALAEGGFAVEVLSDDGTPSMVPVETGAFSDSVVEIRGDVLEGQFVVVPT